MSERDRFYEQRLAKADELRELGTDPYANDFRVDTRIADFHRFYGDKDKEDLQGAEQEHAVAGRVMAINKMGKAAFLRIQDETSDVVGTDGEAVGKLQLYLR